MGVKSILFVITLVVLSLFIVSCSSKNEIMTEPNLYIVEEPQPKVFVVGEKSNIAWIDATKPQRHELNKIRALRDYGDDLEEFEFESRFSNVRRIIKNDFGQRELVAGYDKELDNPGFEKIK